MVCGHLKVLAVQALDTSYSAKRKGEAIAARASTMGLTGEGGRVRSASGVGEARRGSGEAEIGLGEM